MSPCRLQTTGYGYRSCRILSSYRVQYEVPKIFQHCPQLWDYLHDFFSITYASGFDVEFVSAECSSAKSRCCWCSRQTRGNDSLLCISGSIINKPDVLLSWRRSCSVTVCHTLAVDDAVFAQSACSMMSQLAGYHMHVLRRKQCGDWNVFSGFFSSSLPTAALIDSIKGQLEESSPGGRASYEIQSELAKKNQFCCRPSMFVILTDDKAAAEWLFVTELLTN